VKTSGLLDRLDNAVNPIVVKELRQAVKSRLVTSALLLFLLVEMIVLGSFLLARQLSSPDDIDAAGGQAMFLTLQGILVGTCMLVVPAYAGLRLGAERSDSNVDLLFISTLKPRTIIWGKFVAAAVLALLIFSACAPFMTFTYLLRGLDIPTILLVLAVDLLAVLGATMLTLFLASVSGNRALKALVGIVGLGALIYIFIGAMGFSAIMVEGFIRSDPEEFWSMMGALVTSILAVMGLLFVWAVALVSPPSANRALRVRLYEVFLWALLGGVLGTVAWVFKVPPLIYVWMGSMLFLFCLQVVISINEREQWGPRVTRTIPRRGPRRLLAFLFYSGAAGGVIFGMVMIGLTLLGGYLALVLGEGRWTIGLIGDPPRATTVMGIIGLYTYCFALSAVLLRNVLFGQRLKGPFTWVLGIILVSLASAAPYAGMLLFANRPSEFEYNHPWVVLPNPIVSAYQASFPPAAAAWRDFDMVCLGFTLCWACGITLLLLPWYLRQARAFRPPARPPSPSAHRAPMTTAALPVEPVANGAPADAVTARPPSGAPG
jgi:hypothetical protein